MLRLAVILMLSSTAAGCRTKPLYTGPVFLLPDVGEVDQPDASAANDSGIIQASVASNAEEIATIPVRILDARPAWQKQFYNGSSAPQDWEIARTIIPLENFEPPVADHLKRAIEVQLARLTDPPTSVDVTITSFECVCDLSTAMRRVLDDKIEIGLRQCRQEEIELEERRQQRKKSREQEERWERQRPRQPGEKADETSFVGMLFSDLLNGLIQGCIDGIGTGPSRRSIANGTFLPEFQASERYRVVLAPDKQFRKWYPDGLSCYIEADVKMTWSDRREVVKHINGESIASDKLGAEGIGRVVIEATQDAARKIQPRSDLPSGNSGPPELELPPIAN